MGKYILKRLLIIVITILLISIIVYTLMDLAPGDPVRTLVGDNVSDEELEILREELGFNDPLLERYFRYMKGVFSGDFGTTLAGSKPVLQEYASRIPNTLYLAFVSLIFVIIVSIPLGVIAAVKQNSFIDTALSTVAMCGLSLPSFWLGLLLQLLFALNLGWLPTSGLDNGFLSVILPALTLGIGNCALATRITRSAMLDCIRMDYLRTARAKGVKERVVIIKHALRNALIPIVTILGSMFTTTFNSSFVIESIFAWPGVGSLTLMFIRNGDVNATTGCVILTTALTAICLLIVDILYAFIDPRVMAKYKTK